MYMSNEHDKLLPPAPAKEFGAEDISAPPPQRNIAAGLVKKGVGMILPALILISMGVAMKETPCLVDRQN